MVAYCNAPTTDLYKVGLEKELVPSICSFEPGARGVFMGFALCMLTLDKRSVMYLD